MWRGMATFKVEGTPGKLEIEDMKYFKQWE